MGQQIINYMRSGELRQERERVGRRGNTIRKYYKKVTALLTKHKKRGIIFLFVSLQTETRILRSMRT